MDRHHALHQSDLYPKSLAAAYKTSRAARIIRSSTFLQKTVARIIGSGLRPEKP
jgi:hypothetical protein